MLDLLPLILVAYFAQLAWSARSLQRAERRRDLRAAVLDQLAAAARRSLPLAPCLDALAQELSASRRPRDRRAAARLRDLALHLRDTGSLAAALETQPHTFPSDEVAWVERAERHGALPAALDAWRSDVSRSERTTARAFELATVPFTLVTLLVLVTGFMELELYPKFAAIFSSLGLQFGAYLPVALPVPLHTLGTALSLSLAFGALSLCLLHTLRPLAPLRRLTHACLHLLPGLGRPLRALHHARWLSRLASLLEAGVPLPDALDTVAGPPRRLGSHPLHRAADAARQGHPAPSALRLAFGRDAPRLLPKTLLDASLEGRLGLGLAHRADDLERQAVQRLHALGELAKPTLVGLLGLCLCAHVAGVWGALLQLQSSFLN